jgi:hypothetical protein
MNKKVFGIAVFLLAVAILAIPVMAEPTKGQKVPVRFLPLGYYSYEGEDYGDYTTNGGIQIRKNLIVVYDPLQLIFLDGGPTLVGNATITVDSISNLDKNTQIAHYNAVVLFETPEGGFKGEMLAHHKDMRTSEWTLDWHFVLQGFGAFEGQTLQIRLNGPYPGSQALGYLLKP